MGVAALELISIHQNDNRIQQTCRLDWPQLSYTENILESDTNLMIYVIKKKKKLRD